MRRWFAFCATYLVFTASHALASTLTVSESGVFAADTPTTAVSAAGASFSYTFTISANPPVSNVSVGDSFDPAISNFTYTLNGVSLSPVIGSVTVYSLNDGGLFDICFISACSGTTVPDLALELTGPQIYSGSESSPTLRSGIFTPTPQDSFFADNGSYYGPLTASPVTIAATPEPWSIALLGSGILSAFALSRCQRRV